MEAWESHREGLLVASSRPRPAAAFVPTLRASGLAGLVLLLIVSVGSTGCGTAEPTSPDVVAEVAGEVVRYAEFEGYIQATTGDDSAVYGSDVLSGLFDEFLRERCLLVRAVDEKVAEPDINPRNAVRLLLEMHPLPLPEPEEVMAFYQRNRARFATPERFHVRQILVEERGQADQALERLRSGEPFAKVAKEVSTDPSAERGGDQGWLSAEDLPPAFVESIVGLAPGEISEVVAADYGFHLFLIEQVRPAANDFASVELDVTRALDAERGQQQLLQLVEESIAQYNVKIFERNLPFNYQGSLLAEQAP